MVVGDIVGDNVGGDVMAGVGDTVGNWALDLARRRRSKADALSLVNVMFYC